MKRSLRSWLWRVPLDQEIDEELSLHIELRTRELVERGMDPQAARDLVLSRIGDIGQLTRTCVDLGRKRDREMRLTQRLEELGADIRFALRQLKASPGFAFVAAMTLALGIGANSAIFALADAVLLRPLPYANGDRLVFIDEHGPQQGGRSRIELLNFDEWTAQNRTFETMAAIWIPAAGGGPTLMGTDGTPEMLSSQTVTPQYFDVFGVTPILGRTFRPDDPTAQPDAVVLSESFWRRRFAGDPSIIGRALSFEGGNTLTVIGIVPSQFQFRPAVFRDDDVVAKPVSVWLLLPRPAERCRRSARAMRCLPIAAGGWPPEAWHVNRGGSCRSHRTGRDARRADRRSIAAPSHHDADARAADRPGSAAHIDSVSRRRRLRAASLLRERGQPRARARHRADARAGRARGAWRRTAADRRAIADRESGARRGRRRARHRSRRRDSCRGAVVRCQRSCCPASWSSGSMVMSWPSAWR